MRLAVVGTDRAGTDRVAVIRVLERDDLVPARVLHRELERELDGLGTADATKRTRELARRSLDEQLCELGPWLVQQIGRDVRGAVECAYAREDLRRIPPEVADTPAHLKIEEHTAVRVAQPVAACAHQLDGMRASRAAYVLAILA